MGRLNKIPTVALGAINGILLGVLLEIVFRLAFCFVTYLLLLQTPSGWSFSFPQYPYSWYFLPIALFFIVTFSTFMVHRFAANRIKSSIWFWQLTGIVTVSFIPLSLIFYEFYNMYCSQLEIVDFVDTNFVKSLIKVFLLIFLISLPFVATFNLLFALALKALKLRLP